MPSFVKTASTPFMQQTDTHQMLPTMAVSAIGGWMASAGIAKLVDQVCSYAGDQYEYQRDDAKEKLRKLKERLCKIKPVVGTAESLQSKNRSMETWLGSIKDAVYHAQNVLDLFDYRVLEAKAEDLASSGGSNAGSSSSATCTTTLTTPLTSTSTSSTVSRSVRVFRRFVFSDEDLNELIAIVGRFDKIASELPTLLKLIKLEDRKPEPSTHWRRTTSMLGITKFYGRVGEEAQLRNLIVQTQDESCQPYSVISVVGLAGVGKTALVQRVYSHFRGTEQFNFVVWIHVSEKFDAERLTREMVHAQECQLESRGKRRRISWHGSVPADLNSNSSLDQVQRMLQEKLNGKTILVIIDDIWNKMSIQWENLCKPLQFASKGSKVVLTTRSHEVAKINGATDIMHLDGLKDEAFWEYFKQCAFNNATPAAFPHLENIGKLLARKLAGSPLAAKTVGNKLKLKLHEDHWRAVLEAKLWHIEQKEDDIIPALRLSYEHLPDHLKQCFVYFALFPKKHPLQSDVLIQMWRAQGYIQKEITDETAHGYIEDLLQLSFIQKAPNLDDHYIIHDLLHDFAELVSGGEHFCIEDHFHVTVPENVRHLYVNASNISQVFISLTQSEVKKGLRSLIIWQHDSVSRYGIHRSNFNKTLEETLRLPALRSLRVLVLRHQDGTLPDNIEHLVHLRYLDISRSRMFINVPMSLFKLYHLQGLKLNLQSCHEDKIKLGLQKGLSRLTQLRYLTAPSKIISGIEHVGRLTSLHALEEYHVMNDSRHSICQLKELNDIRGKLTIKNLENVISERESNEARLKIKQNLKKISLCWNQLQDENINKVEHEGVLEGLQPNCNLRELHVTGYMGTTSPTWLTREYLPNIQTIELVSCHHWKTLPPFGSLPFLRILRIRHFKAVEKINTEFYGDAAIVFPSLEELLFENMEQWKEWTGVESNRHAFSRLRNICIKQCKYLKGPLPLPASSKGINISVSDWLSASTNSLKEHTDLKNPFSIRLFLDHYGLFFGCLPSNSLAAVHLLELSSRRLVSFKNEQEKWLHKLTSLKELHFIDCATLISLPMNLVHFTTLHTLYIEKCPKLKSFPQIPQSLQKLSVIRCHDNLTDLCSRLNISDISIVPQDTKRESKLETQIGCCILQEIIRFTSRLTDDPFEDTRINGKSPEPTNKQTHRQPNTRTATSSWHAQALGSSSPKAGPSGEPQPKI